MSTIEVDKIIPQSGTALQVGEASDTINVPSGATLNINSGATITNNGTASGFDTDTNDKVKVSTNDTTPGFLNGKLVAGTNISLTEGSDGGNETLTAALSGTITPSDNTVTLAKMAPGTDGNIISYDASGNPVAIATGNDGQVLTSAGAGAQPAFETLPAGGAYVKLETITLSGTASTVEFNTNNFTSTYRDYKMLFSNVNITADGDIYMRIGEAGQATIEASNYRYATIGLNANGASQDTHSVGDSKFVINPDTLNASTRYNNNFEVNIYNPLDTGTYLAYSANGMMNNNNNHSTTMISAGQYADDYAKQFKRFVFFFASGGDWAGTGGTITLLGRAN